MKKNNPAVEQLNAAGFVMAFDFGSEDGEKEIVRWLSRMNLPHYKADGCLLVFCGSERQEEVKGLARHLGIGRVLKKGAERAAAARNAQGPHHPQGGGFAGNYMRHLWAQHYPQNKANAFATWEKKHPEGHFEIDEDGKVVKVYDVPKKG